VSRFSRKSLKLLPPDDIFTVKIHQIFDLGWGLCPRPRWGAYSTPPDTDTLCWISGGLLLKEGRRRGTVREGKNSPLYASQVPTVESDWRLCGQWTRVLILHWKMMCLHYKTFARCRPVCHCVVKNRPVGVSRCVSGHLSLSLSFLLSICSQCYFSSTNRFSFSSSTVRRFSRPYWRSRSCYGVVYVCLPVVAKRCVLPKNCLKKHIVSSLWGIEWSCNRWRHVTLKGQGHDPNTQYNISSCYLVTL